MAAKKKIVAKKGKIAAFKPSVKTAFKKGGRNGSGKIGKKDQQQAEDKEVSKSKLKKKEFQAKRYNKKTKKAAAEEEDSDFEVVPSGQTKPSTFAGTDALESTYTSGEDDSDDEDGGAVDMFGAVASKSSSKDIVGEDNDELDDADQASENSDDESKFIAAENLNANRKKKKSGGFQSMG